MKRAYWGVDGMRLEGRPIVVDVERGHTVPNWLPRRLGGSLGATRLGGRDKNVFMAGRFDPSKNTAPPSDMIPMNNSPPMRMGGPPGPPPHFNDQRPPLPGPGFGRFDDRGPPPPGYFNGGGGRRFDDCGPPPMRYDDRRGGPLPPGYGGYDDRKRRRSRSPDRDRRRGRY